jgi:DNA polymerase-3 subunit epsilon
MSAGWHRGPLLSLDFESCGLPAHDTRAVQIGLARIGYPNDPAPVRHTYLVNPGQPIPAEATAIHHITDAMVLEHGKPYAETLEQVATAVADHLSQGWPLIAFNASFDCTLLEAELLRLGLPSITETCGGFGPVIDPFVIDKQISRRPGKRNLQAQCDHYSVRNDGEHDAGEDALAAARVAWAIAERHPTIAATDPLELHAQQISWAREQRDSLREYFDRKGQTHDGVDPRWPLQLPAHLAARAAS